MTSVTVPVLKAFVFEGRRLRKGDTVEMSPLSAAVHARQGYVSLTKHPAREYQTRELQADIAAESPIDTPRRRYRRRDLVPEE